MGDVFITGAVRTPVGAFNGSLARLSATRLGSVAIEGAIKKAGADPATVEGVILGCVLTHGLGPAPARQAALGAGLDAPVEAFTVNRSCGSGLASIMLAAGAIGGGGKDLMVAGGMENMSRAPYMLDKARFGYRMGDARLIDSILKDCLWDVESGFNIGNHAEMTAAQYSITREEQDEYAQMSYSRALEAQSRGGFDNEIVTMTIPVGIDRFASLNADEGPQKFEHERLRLMKPAFREDGTVTSGNSAPVADGSAAVVLASKDGLDASGNRALARIIGCESVGVDPEMFLTAPALAVKRLVHKAGLGLSDVGLFEINEDYAASIIAVTRDLGLDESVVNINGGSIAMGNPVGASGARILTTLVYAMRERGADRGVAALSAAGGEAVAVLLELV